MKKLSRIFIILTTAILFFCTILTPKNNRLSTYSPTFGNFPIAHAQTQKWARILNDNTPFYADYDCTILKFYLPKTYFVKVVSTGEDATRVIYG